MASFNLFVPSLVQGRQLTAETDPALLKAWLVSLPTGNPIEASRSIFDALFSLNRIAIHANTRLQLIALYQTIIDIQYTALEAKFLTETLPLQTEGLQAARLARNLLIELAYGYKIIFLEKTKKRFNFNLSESITFLARSILCTFQKLLLTCYKTYSPAPISAWQEIHTVFNYALRNKILDKPTKDQNPSNIGTIYKQILLLSLADPYQLKPHDIDQATDIITKYAKYASFQRAQNHGDIVGFFLIHLDSDLRPQYLGQLQNTANSPTDIFLNTINLIRLLRQELVKIGKPALVTEGKAYLFKYLIRHWGITPRRVAQRLQSDLLIKTCVGFANICAHLNQLAPSPPLKEGTLNSPPRYVNWSILNESPHGYALRREVNQSEQIHNDEILAFQISNHYWHLGIIRWVKYSNEDATIDIGVEILSPEARLVRINTNANAANTSDWKVAILLPNIAPIKQAARLITMPNTPPPQRIIWQEGEEETIPSIKLIKKSKGFMLFEFPN